MDQLSMPSNQFIYLTFNRNHFEYDVFHLVKAFFPYAEVKMEMLSDSPAPDVRMSDSPTPDVRMSDSPAPDVRMSVEEDEQSFSFRILEKDGKKIIKNCAVSTDAGRKNRKNALKKIVYEALAEYTGRELPWGDLTGIRPVRIPLDLIEKGWKNAKIAEYMRETFYTSPKKTALAIAIANREKDLLDGIDLRGGCSLYVGIPFCPSICLYCSFGSHPIGQYRQSVEPYLQALYKELSFISGSMAGRKLTSIYIGGGTPTSLDEKQFSELLLYINDHFSFQDLCEFTVEAGRPDTITEEKLCAMTAAGVSRISINPQTMNQKTLDVIGRRHTVEETADAFRLARETGFDNINMDLIAGLPGEGPDEVKETLRQIGELDPDSLTIHSLALKRSSRLNLLKDEYAPLSFYNSEEVMDCVGKTAVSLGMHPYYMYRQKNIAGNLENVGYAKDGCFGIYNILIMEEKQTILAAGAGAMTKFVLDKNRIERVPNVKDVGNYIGRIDEMIERKKEAFREFL